MRNYRPYKCRPSWIDLRQFVIELLLLASWCCPLVRTHAVDDPRCGSDRKSYAQTLATCTYDKDCMDNAYCKHQKTCECMEDYLVDKNRTHVRCLKIATNIGDPCTEDVQCSVTFTAQAECRNNTCGCSPGSHFEAERCYESVGIGHVCQTSHNCYVHGSDSFCVDGYCSCPLQHHPNSDGSRCLKSASLRDKCDIDEECITMHSRCTRVGCDCKVAYVRSMDGQRCLKGANAIGDPCEEDLQCRAFLKNARCGEEGKCRCNMDFKHRGSVCRKDLYTRMLGKRCNDFSDCVEGLDDMDIGTTEVTRADCIKGICSCTKDYELTEDGRDCIGYSEIGGSARWQMTALPTIVLFALTRLF
ncbi:prion-like-(Q/N-rich) domain-bearing protein 25 isoform X2 [Venturia canescens]|uniref:prion-like-(Q/N-rich) domain-bearing protein 25 isoform X2 n=1 Tax=Venturia canescens TaxID=32260 RepID=UPI001C9C3666|nr:prion-like-(Q/N-rich) domain-bearing protein 25 isoform X2 [Venturia canescens]XP_043271053.1 prion-like-(Q/N-rich) domain-bearing protein 25 isoform X2 [Venturia canescens]XP_043271054.1 prion-like-(Q/N-rich) domain-bearing protein 25 isoform X2 [Venturia canescens]XP_043271055.1 prion-like-(Q/N-rich) domain-bearing protein 25 isoform X2 [Venturia canescens]XP_043271057.1 prion-like-(Q/N-rich) domain-bearing protein 25 isoform X2 [Venturia canescens]